ncbi:hypothetical protein VTO73DRAFT_11630 [Trametes versicolor]
MPSPYDILGTVFGVLSLLGIFRCAYGFLKARQPFAQVARLEEMLRATYQRVDELERYGYLAGNPALAAVYRAALRRIDRESTAVRRMVVTNGPKTIAAVLVYAVQHGINSKRSRKIRVWTKKVSLIRHQIEYPYEWPSSNSRISELDTHVETALHSPIRASSETVVAISSGTEALAVPEATLVQRSHIPLHVPWTEGVHRWSNPPIPKTVYGGVRLGAIGLLRRVWRAHWNGASDTPGGLDAAQQEDAQDSDEFRIVANWIEQGTAEANWTYDVPVGKGALVPVVRGGKRT